MVLILHLKQIFSFFIDSWVKTLRPFFVKQHEV